MINSKIFYLIGIAVVFVDADRLTNNNIDALLKVQLRNDYLLEQFLNEEFSYKGIDDLIRPITDLPFRDIHADNFFKVGILPLASLRQHIESKNISRLFGHLDLKPWVSLEFIKDELAKCGVQYNFISMSDQQFTYDKQVYGTMNVVKFACRHAFNEIIVYGVGMERFRFRFKDVLLNKLLESTEVDATEVPSDFDPYTTEAPWPEFTSSPEDQEADIQEIDEAPPSEFMRARFPFISSRKGCINLNPKTNTSETCNNLLSLPQDVKEKLIEMFPYEDIEELPYMTKDHTFKIVSIPIKIRIMLSPPGKVPEILDIFQQDLSTESRDVIENCRDQICDEPDEIVQIHENEEDEEEIQKHHHKKNDIKKFFQDRALRYNIDKETTLLAYGTSSPRLSIDTSTKKHHRYRKPTAPSSDLSSDARALWVNLLQSQVAENFAIHHRPALREY